jgi:hypothetical protein
MKNKRMKLVAGILLAAAVGLSLCATCAYAYKDPFKSSFHGMRPSNHNDNIPHHGWGKR